MRRNLVGAACALTAAGLLAPGLAAAKTPAPKKAFVPHLCAWISGSATSSLELEGGCHEKHVHLKTTHTPFGPLTTAVYTADMGVHPGPLLPKHTLNVAVFHVTGSAKAVSFVEKQQRLEVLGEGLLVASAKGITATWHGETYSCENPPTGDCTQSYLQSIKGAWEVLVGVEGAPPGSPGAAEENSGEDDPQDLAQEEQLKPATVGIGLAVTNKV